MFRREPVPVYGDGQNVRDWLFVEDHCSAIQLVMESAKAGETYCVGGDNEMKNLDLLHLLSDLADQELGRPSGSCRSLLTFVEDRAGHDRRYAIDSSRIQSELGWTPETRFDAGLLATLRWYLPRLTGAAGSG
jgi:dTDP-glucose 4,6-dehydratase